MSELLICLNVAISDVRADELSTKPRLRGFCFLGQSMARPFKLTDKQWTEIERRVLAGESMRALGSEFGVSDTAIRKRLSSHVKPIKTIANQLAEAERAMEALPIGSQVKVRRLADELKDISANLASAARDSSQTAALMANLANRTAVSINPDEVDPEQVKSVMVLTKASNDAAVIGLDLIAANKDAAEKARNADNEIKRIERVIVRAATD